MRTRTPGWSGRRTVRSADRSVEQLGIVGRRERKARAGLVERDLVEGGFERLPGRMPAKRVLHALVVVAQLRDRVAMARGDSGERLRRRRPALRAAARRRSAARRGQPPPRARASVNSDARIGPMQVGGFLAPNLRELAAEGRERMCEPGGAGPRPRAAQDRALQRRDRAPYARRMAAEPEQRMLEQRQQRHRRQPAERRLRDEPREHAGRRVGERIAAGIVDRARSSARAPPARGAPARGRASPAPRSCPVFRPPRAARPRWRAPPPRRWRPRSRTATPARASAWAAKSGSRQPLLPGSVAAAGRSASETSRSRPCGRARAEHAHLVARDADALQQRRHGELRMADRRRDRVARSRGPISSHDGASRSVSRPGSTTAPCGSLAMVASSSAVAGIEPVEPAAITGPSRLSASRLASAAISWSRRAAGSILPRSARIAGQVSRAIFRNRSVSCQYSSCSVRHQLVEPIPGHLPRRHVVHQAREIVGERQRGGRRIGDERRASGGAYLRRGRPCEHELREQQTPLEPAEVVGQLERIRRDLTGRRAAKAISSSSTSPIGTMRGRIAASPLSTSRKLSRASRQARRVGR